MNVGDFFQELALGELRNLYLGMASEANLNDSDKDRIVYFTNRSLTRIFSRFVCRRCFIKLRQVEGRKTYPIQAAFTESNTDPLNTNDRFIIDGDDEPFSGGLIKILSVYAAATEEGVDPLNLLINGGSSEISVKTMAFDTVYFADPVADQEFIIELQLNHTKLTLPHVLDEIITIHPLLEEALALRVAAGVYGSMNGQENLGKSNLLEAQYEAAAALIDSQDLMQNSATEVNNRPTIGGWK